MNPSWRSPASDRGRRGSSPCVLGDPDTFPDTDLGILRGASNLGLADTSASLNAHAQRWRPWRSYAAQHLWAATDHPIVQWPPNGPTDPSKER